VDQVASDAAHRAIGGEGRPCHQWPGFPTSRNDCSSAYPAAEVDEGERMPRIEPIQSLAPVFIMAQLQLAI